MNKQRFLFRGEAKISIVIPAFNEELRLPRLLHELRMMQHDDTYMELIVVDDGSHDNTRHIGQAAIDKYFPLGRVIHLPENKGKGNALRHGVGAATAPIIFTMDADMATDLSAVEPALEALRENHIVIGSRVAEQSSITGNSKIRDVMTRSFSKALSLLIREKLPDTQCGFKAYQSPTAKILFASSVINGFAHDAEILDLATKYELSIAEIPVHWTAVPGSKVKILKDSLKSLYEFTLYRTKRRKADPLRGLILEGGINNGEDQEKLFRSTPRGSLIFNQATLTQVFPSNSNNEEIYQIIKSLNTEFPKHKVKAKTFTSESKNWLNVRIRNGEKEDVAIRSLKDHVGK